MNMKNRIRDTLNKYRDYVDYLEIRIEKGEKLNVSFVGKILRTLNRNVEMGCAIRACYKGGWGFCSVVDLDKMDEMTELVIQQAKLAKKDKTILADVKPSEDDLRVSLIDDPRNYPISENIDFRKEH